MGKGAPKWHRFTAVVQDNLPFAEYADRKYEAFETHSGFPNPNRDVAEFTQQLLADAAPHIQKVLAIGINPGNSFNDIVVWASRLEEQTRKNTSASHPIAAVRENLANVNIHCNNCGKWVIMVINAKEGTTGKVGAMLTKSGMEINAFAAANQDTGHQNV